MGKSVDKVNGFYRYVFAESDWELFKSWENNRGLVVQAPFAPYYGAHALVSGFFQKRSPKDTGNSGPGVNVSILTDCVLALLTIIPVLPALTVAAFALTLVAALFLAVTYVIPRAVAGVVDALRKEPGDDVPVLTSR